MKPLLLAGKKGKEKLFRRHWGGTESC